MDDTRAAVTRSRGERAAEIAAALDSTRARIADAERAAGRAAGSVRLIAVSKRMPEGDLRAALAARQRDFGENYAQELRDKRAAFASSGGTPAAGLAPAVDSTPVTPPDTQPDLRWHFIGPLQSNKLKYLVGQVALIHTVDSPELVAQIDLRLGLGLGATPSSRDAPAPRTQDCLVQVNLAGASRQSGVPPERLGLLLDAFAASPRVACIGLMLIPPQSAADDPIAARRHFATLRELAERERRRTRPNVDLRELSMGMSHDFSLAIAEGATMVRVGTAIFGARPR
jgi:pyridoxal phosphate enzyme (YggS family)